MGRPRGYSKGRDTSLKQKQDKQQRALRRAEEKEQLEFERKEEQERENQLLIENEERRIRNVEASEQQTRDSAKTRHKNKEPKGGRNEPVQGDETTQPQVPAAETEAKIAELELKNNLDRKKNDAFALGEQTEITDAKKEFKETWLYRVGFSYEQKQHAKTQFVTYSLLSLFSCLTYAGALLISKDKTASVNCTMIIDPLPHVYNNCNLDSNDDCTVEVECKELDVLCHYMKVQIFDQHNSDGNNVLDVKEQNIWFEATTELMDFKFGGADFVDSARRSMDHNNDTLISFAEMLRYLILYPKNTGN